jgi:hypothetical protein
MVDMVVPRAEQHQKLSVIYLLINGDTARGWDVLQADKAADPSSLRAYKNSILSLLIWGWSAPKRLHRLLGAHIKNYLLSFM